MAQAFIGVGANLQPEANIRRALRLLAAQARLLAISTFYRSPALGRPDQPDYDNGVVSIRTDERPEALKATLQSIERALGRHRTEDRYAARPIDLDLLLYDSLCIDRPDMLLPSADIQTRAFVAVPLAELAPELELPGSGEPISTIAARLPKASLDALVPFTDGLRDEWGCPSRPRERTPGQPH